MKKKLLIPLIIILLITVGVSYYIFIYKESDNDSGNNNNNETTEVTAGIYKLVNKPTKYQKEIFNELKEILESENYEEEDLAVSLVKNFIVEFYTLSNVESKDVRATQFISDDLKERFVAFGSDVYTYYAYYENKDDLEVESIEVTDTEKISYDYKDDLGEIESKDNLDGYEITVNWKYKDNSEHESAVTIVKWDDNYSIVKVENKE